MNNTFQPLAVFKRIVTLPHDSDSRSHEDDALLFEMMRARFAPRSFCFTSFEYVAPFPEQQCILVLSDDATAIRPDTPCQTCRGVYEPAGFIVSEDGKRNALNRLKLAHDIDFSGTIIRDVNGFVLRGDQSDAFADLSALAVVVDSKVYPELPRAAAPVFENVQRSEVKTDFRHPIQRLSLPSEAVCVGEGFLCWSPAERHSDRFGFVKLSADFESQANCNALHAKAMVGKRGTLVAEIVESRPVNSLWGDDSRRFFPQPVTQGDVICLGSGRIRMTGQDAIGCLPDDDREIDWLNPRALYACMAQRVRLHVLPQS